MTAEGPHSRACGWRAHEHGDDCADDCPTCKAKLPAPIVEPNWPAPEPPDSIIG